VHDILAQALAHEMGHVLLPYPSHSLTGIMRADWDGDDIRRAFIEPPGFTAAQTALIHQKLSHCCVRENP
jgi:hypothetical protein